MLALARNIIKGDCMQRTPVLASLVTIYIRNNCSKARACMWIHIALAHADDRIRCAESNAKTYMCSFFRSLVRGK